MLTISYRNMEGEHFVFVFLFLLSLKGVRYIHERLFFLRHVVNVEIQLEYYEMGFLGCGAVGALALCWGGEVLRDDVISLSGCALTGGLLVVL